MSFRIVESNSAPSNGNEVLLIRDNWNDYFVWVTQFHVIVVTQENQRIDIGEVKIAQAGMTHQSATEPPRILRRLLFPREWSHDEQSKNTQIFP